MKVRYISHRFFRLLGALAVVEPMGVTSGLTQAPSSCVPQAPTISVLPSATTWARSGATVAYFIKVTNKEGTGCNAADFELGVPPAAVPAGWTVKFEEAKLNLAAGENKSTTLRVTSPPTAPAATYEFNATATKANGGPSGSAKVSQFVAPNLTIDVSTTGSLNRTGMTNVSATVKAGQTAVAAIIKVSIKDPSGQELLALDGVTNTDGTAMIPFELTKKDPAGAYQITVTADKNGVKGTGTTSITVQ